ncbi:MAG: class F sortase [Candidatus Saccharimonadales bacterium]|mgnify:FL=1
MPKERLTLDNPVFSETLRRPRPSVSYGSRALLPRTMQDVATVRVARKAGPIMPRQASASSMHPKQGKPVQEILRQRTRPSVPLKQHKSPGVAREFAENNIPSPNSRSKPTIYLLQTSAIIVFALGLAAAYNGFTANNKVISQVKALESSTSSEPDASSGDRPPSTQKPSAKAIRNYMVSPLNPRYIEIPAFKTKARVLSMTVDKSNELQAPYGIYDAGWYSSSSRPGENGAMLIDGHSGVGKTNGIFHNISKLPIGAEIRVIRGDGKVFTYAIVKKEIVDAKKVDMGKLLVSQDTAKPGLNLITCTGSEEPGTFTLKQRALVYAVQK